MADIVQPKTEHSEFLIHAADVEGLCQGIDKDLVSSQSHYRFHSRLTFSDVEWLELGQWVTIPTTYAGGAKGELPHLDNPLSSFGEFVYRPFGPHFGRSTLWRPC